MIQLPYFAVMLGFVGLVILIGGPILLLGWLQGRLIYPHERLRRGISRSNQDARIGTIRVRTADGVELTCDYAPPRDPTYATVVLFHGNGDDIDQRAHIGQALLDAGYGVLLAAYRGYGAPGRPSEAGLYADGRAALAFAKQHAREVVVHGFALGSGVAVQLASETPLAALVLEAPFTSIADVAAARIRWLPTRAFVRDRYDNLAKIGKVSAPTLIYGGAADRVIPPAQFTRLYEAVQAPKRLEIVAGATHADAWERGGDAIVMHFLAEVLGHKATN
ncbi:alpha/beta hydrolase [Paraburkholderia bannensis]|uniref:alpha/beta hydrolase n=1 Tax=Paraburkholderia bannensis TaxID=765414 RepID=UPI002ABD481F|nr:alpha/beta hydrolase [Paraburkholderia bannensis]